MITLQQVELGVLGPLQVRQYGLPVAIPGAKPRAILTMLGLHGGSVVSADTLLELLWGDDPPRTAAKALQTHISSLRRTLGDGFVLTEGTGWTLTTTEIDASRYKAAARMGREAIASGDTSQAVARFDEALALWRGVPELPEGSRGTSEKTRWIEGHAALVEDRADALLATGRAAEIVGELEAAVGDAPLRERRWGQLMLALYRAGRQGEALGAFQRARSLLADQLGVDPGPDLRRLEAAIVAQDDALEMPVSQQLQSVTRAVTFLLTDIEGSTAAWEADADAMAVALARHDEIVEQVVTSRGGRLIKTRGEGDATFSVFDRPSAAAAAAIELQEAILHEPWPLAEPMRIRVALHTGEVELRDGDYFGRAVNRAARLRSLAAGGQILCSGATAELVIDSLSDDVVLADLGMRQLKNLPRPEHVFELRLENADDLHAPATDVPIERPGLPAVLAGPGPFVGRGPELERLLSAWQTMLTGGAVAVLIAGEPGVGKTRLAGEWSRHAYEQGAVVLYGRCDEDLGAPYQPFAEALRSLVPCLGAKRLRGLRGVEGLLPLVPGLADALPDLATPTRADPDTERYALFDAVVAMLGVAAASAPVVLILDDLHWAAKPTLLLLRHLLRFGEHARVQIVGTYRSTDLDRSHPLAATLADLHRDGSASRLALSGLDEGDVTTYVAEAGYDDEELARALAAVTGGNPFFLIEALRHVDESGGRWDPSTLPQGVREAVSRRLSRLPAETNKALAAAAVVGSHFALALVESVVGGDLIDAFDEASKAGIVIEEPGGRYRFNHAIVRQSLLAELASVRRMRLHQKIAATLETEPGADDELLAELAYHYFECAWAGNAAKAVEYCRRAADQAMARLAYEGAADLYDRAWHALEEIDDELPDRDDQQAELLVARCEALLAAGDVVSARGAVSQLQEAAGDSGRLAAWGTCFDGQLSMLTDPERLDEIESAVGAAAEALAGLDDAAGEAKAHTVRAGCLARLGRIGDCETALDQALTAARRAREHRRVNAVLAQAPLAALWGPNPVPRAGGRCLDVVRLLRITTGSPVVEATSTRCQGVLDAFRGRAAAGRQLIDSARRTLTELGMRHARLEVDQFAGIVELVADDPAAAEPHLRRAYTGFRRMGLDVDTAETAALLARACLALGRDVEADELCTESERLAGHALKASITWRTVRALLLARGGARDEARRVAEEAVTLAGRTDALVDHGDACLALATVLGTAGDTAGARAAAGKAVELYELKGAAALAEKARHILGGHAAAQAVPKTRSVELDNACVRAIGRLDDAGAREAWGELEQVLASNVSVESRRKIVGLSRIDLSPSEWVSEARRFLDTGVVRARREVIAVRGERLALIRTMLGTADESPGAPEDELIHLMGLDEEGRIALHMSFDIDDMDAAMAELDAAHARFEESHPRVPQENAASRADDRMNSFFAERRWDDLAALYADDVRLDDRRKGLRGESNDRATAMAAVRAIAELGVKNIAREILAIRGERLVLSRARFVGRDRRPEAFHTELLRIVEIDSDERIVAVVDIDPDDVDAAFEELDAAYARLEGRPHARLENAATRIDDQLFALFVDSRWDEMGALYADNILYEDRRQGLRRESADRASQVDNVRAIAALGFANIVQTPVALRGDRLCLSHVRYETSDPRPDAFDGETLAISEVDTAGVMVARIVFDPDDYDAAFEELDARYLAGEAAPHAQTWALIARARAMLMRRELPPTTPDWVNLDHRRGIGFAPGDLTKVFRDRWDHEQEVSNYIENVHRLNELGAVFTQIKRATTEKDFEAEWRAVELMTVQGDLINRAEFFDEVDLDAALAKFGQLTRPATSLENSASRADARFNVLFAERRWGEAAALWADNTMVEDRRRVFRREANYDRATGIAEIRAMADLGVQTITSHVIAIRGERLALLRIRYSGRHQRPEAFHTEVLRITELDADNRVVRTIALDTDDIDAAFEELDARYLVGEAAPYARVWQSAMDTLGEANRHEPGPILRGLTYVDHRRVSFGSGNFGRAVEELWALVPDACYRATAIHALDAHGTVASLVIEGTESHGNELEWARVVSLVPDKSRMDVYDEEDVATALAEFEQLTRPAPQLQNAASRADARFNTLFADRRFDEIGALFVEDVRLDDRRRGLSRESTDRETAVADIRTLAEVGATNMTSDVLAIRGERLALVQTRYSGRDQRPEAFHTDLLRIAEVDADGQTVAYVAFDPDDLNAAIEELDTRYLAGEAAAHTHTWSVIAAACATLIRRELPPTTPEWVNLDHRRGIGFAPGDMTKVIRDLWGHEQDVSNYIENVYRLNNLGAVFTQVVRATADRDFEAEWRVVELMTVQGDLISRVEFFDEADLDAALAKFEQLTRPAPLLENAASRAYERLQRHFSDRDWDAMSEILAADIHRDDRRRVVNAEASRGREATIAEARAVADMGVKIAALTVIATRGELLALVRSRFSGRDQRPEAFNTESLCIAEVDGDGLISEHIMFDFDDLDGAIAELDARYIAGEAADCASTWSVIAGAYAALNRDEISQAAQGLVFIDHRLRATVEGEDLTGYLRAAWDQTPNLSNHIEAVHRLSNLGAVVTNASNGTSPEGFHVEWRMIEVLMVDGDKVSRTELFDEVDLDAALARFDELSQPTRQLTNAATQVAERYQRWFANRDWAAMAEELAEDVVADDRRRVVNAGIRRGRDVHIADMSAVAEVGAVNMTSTVVATRGERLALIEVRTYNRGPAGGEVGAENLGIVDINAHKRIVAIVMFDPDDLDAAFEELDARYLAGEAAPHPYTWSVIANAYAAFNRRELLATRPEWANVDHRRGAAFAPGDMIAYIQAAWDDSPDTKIYIAAVHRLSDLGGVVTHVAHGISQEGFDAEWRDIHILTVEGEALSRSELFDEADLDAALARFEELQPRTRRLENAASQVYERLKERFAARDWDAISEMLADDISNDDRRQVVNAGVHHGRDAALTEISGIADVGITNWTSDTIATRGKRLVLNRARLSVGDGPEAFFGELLSVVEVDADERVVARIVFDPDDIDAAFEELDARYLAGEAAAHAQTWSVIAGAYAALNQREIPAITPDWVSFDHRRVASIAPGDLIEFVHAAWELERDIFNHVATVHRMNDLGAIVTRVSNGTSRSGFDAEWRAIDLMTVEGDLVSRFEMFDETDIDAALARFDELSRPTPRLENAASQADDRFKACFAARDWESMSEILAEDFSIDDRRRVVNIGIRKGRDVEIANMRATAEIGATMMTFDVVASRGNRLALSRIRAWGPDQQPDAFHTDALGIVETDAENRIAARVAFDIDDVEAAFEELDARYVAGEAAAHAQTWSVITGAFASVNRHELPELTPDWVNVDHRRAASFAPGEMATYTRATWDQLPDVRVYIEAVHRLTKLGTVITQAASGTSQDGFHAEWREISIFSAEGPRLSRCELFDESDLDSALACFDELTRPAPQLENTASRTYDRFNAYLAVRDWDAMADLLADDACNDDRRRVVSGGIQRGRDAQIANLRTVIDLGVRNMESVVIATRGERIALSRTRVSGGDQRPDAFDVELLNITEIDTDNRIAAGVLFDVNDIGAAFEELDARFLAGEAAAHAETWSLISRASAAFNRHVMPPTTPDWVNIDHRKVTAFAPGDMTSYMRATFDVAPDVEFYIEAVHRLNNLGVVFTQPGRGISHEGFEAEWRDVILMSVEGDQFNRCELFDEADLDAALARFDELSGPVPRLENAASQVYERFWTYFGARDWASIAEMFAAEIFTDDRRRVVNAGVQHGRDAEMASMRSLAEIGANITWTVMATRGERLVLSRVRSLNRDLRHGEFDVEMLSIIEIDADNRIAAGFVFDLDDIDAAFEELDARYVAGEAAPHAKTWSAIAQAFAAVNRHELPRLTPDWMNVDHRRAIAVTRGDMTAYIRATLDDAADLRVYIEAVHRLTDLGVVVTQASRGTSHQGFDAEWRMVSISTVDGDQINRGEIFDETDIDAALTRFDELSRPAPRLENAASRVGERFSAYMAAPDWAAMAEMVAEDMCNDDRRPVVNAGLRRGRDAEIANVRTLVNLGVKNTMPTVIATRGERLALSRIRISGRDVRPEAFHTEVFGIIEIDADNRIAARVWFDVDDIDAAFAELDARYLAGEAAPYSQTWSVITHGFAVLNRREMPQTTPDWVNIDHRRGTSIAPGDIPAVLDAAWEHPSDLKSFIAAVHRLNDLGGVITHIAHETSQEGFYAEWRVVSVLTLDGDLVNRCEVFDEADLDTALARFDELTS